MTVPTDRVLTHHFAPPVSLTRSLILRLIHVFTFSSSLSLSLCVPKLYLIPNLLRVCVPLLVSVHYVDMSRVYELFLHHYFCILLLFQSLVCLLFIPPSFSFITPILSPPFLYLCININNHSLIINIRLLSSIS